MKTDAETTAGGHDDDGHWWCLREWWMMAIDKVTAALVNFHPFNDRRFRSFLCGGTSVDDAV